MYYINPLNIHYKSREEHFSGEWKDVILYKVLLKLHLTHLSLFSYVVNNDVTDIKLHLNKC